MEADKAEFIQERVRTFSFLYSLFSQETQFNVTLPLAMFFVVLS